MSTANDVLHPNIVKALIGRLHNCFHCGSVLVPWTHDINLKWCNNCCWVAERTLATIISTPRVTLPTHSSVENKRPELCQVKLFRPDGYELLYESVPAKSVKYAPETGDDGPILFQDSNGLFVASSLPFLVSE